MKPTLEDLWTKVLALEAKLDQLEEAMRGEETPSAKTRPVPCEHCGRQHAPTDPARPGAPCWNCAGRGRVTVSYPRPAAAKCAHCKGRGVNGCRNGCPPPSGTLSATPSDT